MHSMIDALGVPPIEVVQSDAKQKKSAYAAGRMF
jgi:hypothetical protein